MDRRSPNRSLRLNDEENERYWQVMDSVKARAPYVRESDVLRELLGLTPLAAITQAELDRFRGIATAPVFDLEQSLAKHDDPHIVMSEWFASEGREYPEDFGVVFFQGWETYTGREKLEAIRDAKKVLDRTLRK